MSDWDQVRDPLGQSYCFIHNQEHVQYANGHDECPACAANRRSLERQENERKATERDAFEKRMKAKRVERNKLAKSAMVAIIQKKPYSKEGEGKSFLELAKGAYAYADAMLAVSGDYDE